MFPKQSIERTSSPLMRAVIFFKLKSTILTELSNEKHPPPPPPPAPPPPAPTPMPLKPPPEIDTLFQEK